MLADALIAPEEALRYGGRDGIRSLHLIQSAIARPYSGYHRAMSQKTAALLQSMVGNHGFVDANKRTAWLLVAILIGRSDYRLEISGDVHIDDLVVDVAERRITFEQLERWFAERLARA